jgi:hypothetical protein
MRHAEWSMRWTFFELRYWVPELRLQRTRCPGGRHRLTRFDLGFYAGRLFGLVLRVFSPLTLALR